jgi:putative FmdB family regulatory protein
MPIYEYVCSACEETMDVLQKVDDPAPAKCERCGAEGTLTRMVSRTSFVLKGGGWYSDLYGSSKKKGGAADSSSAPSGTTEKTGTTDKTSSDKGTSQTSTPAATKPAGENK